MDDDRLRRWQERHRTAEEPGAPSPFVVDALALLGAPASAAGDRALDLACGRGRHALLLAERGYRVDAVDFALPALTILRRHALARRLDVRCLAADVGAWPLPTDRYALVLVVSFLDRSVFPTLRAAVAPGGVLLYETHARRTGIASAVRTEFCLAPGELDALCADWEVLLRRDDDALLRGRRAPRAGILARRPASAH
ncbi:MAG: methyltransferase domain-containing protein [Deltaproteobacteria bacterium]|nr:methyltransferase domain-containing protein [Deltaproteobacteria bacterium]